jgi:hypothetical protein
MSGTIFPVPPYTFMACTGTPLLFTPSKIVLLPFNLIPVLPMNPASVSPTYVYFVSDQFKVKQNILDLGQIPLPYHGMLMPLANYVNSLLNNSLACKL